MENQPKHNQNLKSENDSHSSMALFAQYNPAPVFRFNKEGIILECNIAAKTIFKKNTLNDINVREIIPQIKELDLHVFIDAGEITSMIRDVDGRNFRFELRGISQYEVCQVYGADITEIQQTKRENLRLNVAIEQSSNLIMITDTKGNIEFVNKAFEDITGYKGKDVIGKNPRILKTNYLSKEVYKELWETIASGKVWRGEFHNRKKDGSTYWEDATITPVKDENGNIMNYMAIKEDITEKKKVQKELHSMALFAKLNPEPVFRFNKERTILQSNPAANEVFNKETLVNENINRLLPPLEKIDIVELIENSKILTLSHTIKENIFRFIIRGISELNMCQIYGSDITERVKAAEKIKKQKSEIEQQHEELKSQSEYITAQNRKITDSIKYASRIQAAVLPQHEYIKKFLPRHFILFKPRDIVSGDFYWATAKNNKIVLVAADCTGHGVPGAFMSMLGVSFLNEIVNKNPITTAGFILDNLRDYVKSTLSQEGKTDEAKDGMDLSLCIIDKENSQLQFAGAYNPLVYFRNGEMYEIKADRMPIGIHSSKETPFTNHTLDIEKEDVFYMFSDGYHDQFGGDKRRKLMKKPFKSLLGEIHQKPLVEQMEILDKENVDWIGNYEQIDDIIVVGFKI